MKFDHLRIWIFVCLVLLLFSACSTQPEATAAPLPTEPPSVPTEAPAVPVDEPVERVFGPGTFSLDLPEGWDIFGPSEVTSDPDRPYEVYRLGEDPTASGGPGLSIVAIDREAKWTPEEFALAQCSTCPNNGFESITIDGIPGLRTEIGGGGVPMMVTWYFLEHQGNFIAFAIHDPETLEPLEDVIQSIQFD